MLMKRSRFRFFASFRVVSGQFFVQKIISEYYRAKSPSTPRLQVFVIVFFASFAPLRERFFLLLFRMLFTPIVNVANLFARFVFSSVSESAATRPGPRPEMLSTSRNRSKPRRRRTRSHLSWLRPPAESCGVRGGASCARFRPCPVP